MEPECSSQNIKTTRILSRISQLAVTSGRRDLSLLKWIQLFETILRPVRLHSSGDCCLELRHFL